MIWPTGRVAELDDRLDHLPLVLVDDAFLLPSSTAERISCSNSCSSVSVSDAGGPPGAGGAADGGIRHPHQLGDRQQQPPQHVQRADGHADDDRAGVAGQGVGHDDGEEEADRDRERRREA